MVELLESRDEWLHFPGPEGNWRESHFFAFHDQTGRAGLTYISLSPHSGVVERLILVLIPEEGKTLLWMQRDPLHRYDDSVLAEGSLQYHCSVPLQRWQLRGAASCLSVHGSRELSAVQAAAWASPVPVGQVPVAFDLQFEARMPAYLFPSGAWDFLGRGQQHVEQMGWVSGWLRIGNESTPVAGLGSRDHSWGPREWLGHEWYHWMNFQLGGSFFVGAAVGRVDGHENCSGFVYRDGRLEPVVWVSLRADRDADDLHLRTGTVYVVTAQGKALAMDLAPSSFLHTIVARNEGHQAHDAYTAVTCRCDGWTGRGFVEYARREPVGTAGPGQAGLW